jgi:hypothetical protein
MASTAANYHRMAEECRQEAHRARWDKAEWLRLADDWQQLAESAGALPSVSTVLATLSRGVAR